MDDEIIVLKKIRGRHQQRAIEYLSVRLGAGTIAERRAAFEGFMAGFRYSDPITHHDPIEVVVDEPVNALSVPGFNPIVARLYPVLTHYILDQAENLGLASYAVAIKKAMAFAEDFSTTPAGL